MNNRITQITSVQTRRNTPVQQTAVARKDADRIYTGIRKALLSTLIVFVLATNLAAQDTDFWFVAPDLSNQGGACGNSSQLDRPAMLVISNGSGQSANIQIWLYNNGVPQTINKTILAGSLYYHTFTGAQIEQIENPYTQAGAVTKYGVRITSDINVNVYYQVLPRCNQEIYTLKGRSALGTKFYIPMINDDYYTTGNYSNAFDQIDIVASEDGTTVTVTATQVFQNTGGSPNPVPAGTPIIRTLNKGETLKIREPNRNTAGSLAGTLIESDKPIAVTSTEDLLGRSGTGQDVIGDQIVPLPELGRNYVVIKGYLTGSDRAYFVATENGTTITVNSGTITTSPVLNAGQCWVYNLGNGGNANTAPLAVSATANKPVYCYHISGAKATSDELGSALMPSIYSIGQTRLSYYQYAPPGNNTYYAFVAFRTGAENNFTISYNGSTSALPVTPINIPGLSEWKAARITLPVAAANYVVTIGNSKSVFSYGYFSMNTSGGGASYGYMSAFGEFKFTERNVYKCAGSSVLLEGGYAKDYVWTLPNGTTQSGATLSSLTASQPGRYIIEMDQDPHIVKDTCYVHDVYFNASLQRTPSVGDVDAGSPVSFSVAQTPISGLLQTYAWTFPDGAQPATSTDATPSVTWYEAGVKNVSLTLSYHIAPGVTCDTTLYYQTMVRPIAVNSPTGKSATLSGTPGNGTSAAPVEAYRADSIVYAIEIKNESPINTDISVYDTVPAGLQIGSISDGGVLVTNLSGSVIKWENLTVATLTGVKTVSYTATPTSGEGALQTVFENKAYIWYDKGGKVVRTNSTWHRAAAFTVSFAATAGGSLTNDNPQTTDYMSAPLPGVIYNIQTGYTFNGWSHSSYVDRNGATVPAASGIADYTSVAVKGNLTLTANFSTIEYDITYDLDGGTAGSPANPAKYYVTTDTITLSNPVRAGYTFAGWTGSNGTTPQITVMIPKGSTGNRQYTANWTTNSYTIQYNYGGGTAPSVPNPSSYNVTMLPIPISNQPTCTGYTFAGWTNDSIAGPQTPDLTFSIVNAPTPTPGVPGNLSFTAHWTTIPYTITYNYYGGSASNLSGYDIETPTFTLNNPTKAGYTFVGWTGSNGTTLHDTVHVLQGTTGNLTFDAHWNFRFATDTIYACTAPVSLASGHDGLGYEWILPDGSNLSSADINALSSGRYILRTNYGTMVVADTVYVLVAFPSGLAIHIHTIGGDAKVGRPQTFSVDMDPHLVNITWQWSFGSDATPATSMSPMPTVVWQTPGRKQVIVTITVTDNGLSCTQTLSLSLDVYPRGRGLFVNCNVKGGQRDGSSWANAFETIQEALTHAGAGDCIWVAKGEYTPDAGVPYIMSRDSVEIYGGFGAWEDYLYQRNPTENPTVLQGAGDAVISTSAVGAGARWDGFVVAGGRSDRGAGIRNSYASVTLANLIIRDNVADSYGGGIYTSHGSPELYNVEISGNTAGDGAGMYNTNAHPQLTNVTIAGNLSTGAGGGLYNDHSNPLIRNTILYGNRAAVSPGIYNNASVPVIGYSVVEGALTGGKWNTATGMSIGNNMDSNPMFVKNGFGNGGMVRGDYRLKISSPAINKGLSMYVQNMPVRWYTHLQTFEGNAFLYGLPYDLDYKERVVDEDVDMGAYEHGSVDLGVLILREVIIPYVEGAQTIPAAGSHFVKTHNNFVLTIKPKGGYSLNNMVFSTGVEIRDKEGLQFASNSDGSVTITILAVTETLNLSISGISPENNEAINGDRVWVFGNRVHIRTQQPSNVQIYNALGQRYRDQNVPEGDSFIVLQRGFYTVVLNSKPYKVVVK